VLEKKVTREDPLLWGKAEGGGGGVQRRFSFPRGRPESRKTKKFGRGKPFWGNSGKDKEKTRF